MAPSLTGSTALAPSRSRGGRGASTSERCTNSGPGSDSDSDSDMDLGSDSSSPLSSPTLGQGTTGSTFASRSGPVIPRIASSSISGPFVSIPGRFFTSSSSAPAQFGSSRLGRAAVPGQAKQQLTGAAFGTCQQRGQGQGLADDDSDMESAEEEDTDMESAEEGFDDVNSRNNASNISIINAANFAHPIATTAASAGGSTVLGPNSPIMSPVAVMPSSTSSMPPAIQNYQSMPQVVLIPPLTPGFPIPPAPAGYRFVPVPHGFPAPPPMPRGVSLPPGVLLPPGYPLAPPFLPTGFTVPPGFPFPPSFPRRSMPSVPPMLPVPPMSPMTPTAPLAPILPISAASGMINLAVTNSPSFGSIPGVGASAPFQRGRDKRTHSQMEEASKEEHANLQEQDQNQSKMSKRRKTNRDYDDMTRPMPRPRVSSPSARSISRRDLWRAMAMKHSFKQYCRWFGLRH
ncbi:hypothetical protein BGX23_002028 [Mortierella sp. AD031]|nr:hypothetical protein BGX23_002028 [Mortierella sp. AD031]